MRRRVVTAVAAGLLALTLAGCAAGGSAPDVEGTTIPQPRVLDLKGFRNVVERHDVTYAGRGGTARSLNVCEPSKKATSDRAAIVVVHGGSWRAGDKNNPEWNGVCQWLGSAGFVAFSIDYRLAPGYPFPDGLHDVQAAVEWVRRNAEKYHVDPERIGAFGGSAGGNLVAMLGTSGHGSRHTGSRVAAVAELSGPADLTKRGDELSDFMPLQLAYLKCRAISDCPAARRASPIYQVDVSDPPFFVGHSIDERIPLSQSEAFVSELRKHGVDTTFVTVKGTLHSIAMLGPDMRRRIVAFFNDKLEKLPH